MINSDVMMRAAMQLPPEASLLGQARVEGSQEGEGDTTEDVAQAEQAQLEQGQA